MIQEAVVTQDPVQDDRLPAVAVCWSLSRLWNHRGLVVSHSEHRLRMNCGQVGRFKPLTGVQRDDNTPQRKQRLLAKNYLIKKKHFLAIVWSVLQLFLKITAVKTQIKAKVQLLHSFVWSHLKDVFPQLKMWCFIKT